MNTTMNIFQDKDINEFIELIKVCKSDEILMINNNFVYSSNLLLMYMKTINIQLQMFQNNNIWYVYSIKLLVDRVCSKKLYRLEMDMYGNIYTWFNGESEPIIIINNMISPSCINTINSCIYTDSRTSDKSYDNIMEDTEIIQLQSCLSKDGLIMYRKDGYMMSLYKGLLPLNKSDILSLDIYNDYNEDNELDYFTTRFIVHKKKFDVNVYIKFRYL